MAGARTQSHRLRAAIGLLLAIVAALLVQSLTAERAGAATARAAGVVMVSKTFHITRPNDTERLVVRCPGHKTALGGGMTSTPPPGPDGEGIYPHSYERLGVQRGWHSTVILYDPSPGKTTPRDVTLQANCMKGKPGKITHPTPHDILKKGQPTATRTAVAKCHGRSHLFSGGFQRTYFDNLGGNFITESRAVSSKKWSVTARGFGSFGAELVAIAYCVKGKHARLTEVSGSMAIAPGKFATATTPPCPAGRQLTAGGFSTSPTGSTLVTNGVFNADGTWSTSGFNKYGPAASVTAYGYCLQP